MTTAASFVEVVWHDAHADTDSWVDVGDIDREPCRIVSVGILLDGVKPDHVVICQSKNETGQVDCVLSIPAGMVRSVRFLVQPMLRKRG